MKLLKNILVNFKWYRKKIGSKWYNVMMTGSEGGIEGPLREWTQNIDTGLEWIILEEENWPAP